MAFKIGSTSIVNVKKGSTDIEKVYVGSNLIWDRNTLPTTPVLVGVTGGGNAYLSWGVSTYAIGSVVSYKLYRQVDDDGYILLSTLTVASGIRTYDDIGVPAGHLYSYIVYAIGNDGKISLPSNVISHYY